MATTSTPDPDELDDELDDAEPAGRLVPGLVTVADPERGICRVPGVVVVPAGYELRDGLLWPRELEPDLEPHVEPLPLWEQRIPVWGPGDRPVHGEPVIEVWHGSPREPSATVHLQLVRDRAAFRNPAHWRAWLGAVDFELRARASLEAPAEVLGRWLSIDTVPSVELGGSAATPRIMVALPGIGLMAATSNGQVHADGSPIYTITAAQLEGLRRRLLEAR